MDYEGDFQVTLPLRNERLFGGVGDTDSKIKINVKELARTNYEQLILQLSGINLTDKDFIGKSDPFIEIHNASKPVHKTEVRCGSY